MPSALPQTIIFDWDNTLVDSWEAIADAINTTLVHFDREKWDMRTVKKNCVRSARESFPHWFGDKWREASDIFYERFSQVQMQALAPALGAEKLLQWLCENNIPLCVVSNKNGRYLREESTALGWNKYFLSIVGATDAPKDKPSREHADWALRLAGLNAGPEVWFVGDSDADILCAKNAGCTPVLMGSEEKAKILKVDMFVEDCQKLLELLNSI